MVPASFFGVTASSTGAASLDALSRFARHRIVAVVRASNSIPLHHPTNPPILTLEPFPPAAGVQSGFTRRRMRAGRRWSTAGRSSLKTDVSCSNRTITTRAVAQGKAVRWCVPPALFCAR
jgi:hypothetical protein